MTSTGNQNYIYGKNFLWFAASFSLLFIASKSLGLTLGYALDDYSTLLSDKGKMQGFFVSQGRFTFALIQSVIDASDLKQPDLAGLGFFLSAGGLLLISWLTLAKWFENSKFLAIALGALLGAHPFFTEYVSFRQSLFPMGICLLLVAGAVFLLAQEAHVGVVRFCAACLLAALASGLNQISMAFFCIAALGISLQKNMHRPPLSAMLLGIRSTFLAGAVAGIFYLLLFRLAIRMVAVDPNARTAVLRAGDIGSRSADIAKLLTSIFEGSHPLIGPVTAICTAATILLFCVRASTENRQWIQVLAGGVVIVTGILLAILPVSLSGVWWPMPRTLIALPLAIALGIAVLSFGTSRLQLRLASGMLFIAISILAGKSGALLLNQQRLNRWDMKLAGEIIIKVSEIKPIDASTPIFIHRAKWAYEIGQSLPLGDANTSALASRWTINPLFEEATGRQLNVRLDTEGDKMCDTLPAFPNSGSIREVEGAVHVCL